MGLLQARRHRAGRAGLPSDRGRQLPPHRAALRRVDVRQGLRSPRSHRTRRREQARRPADRGARPRAGADGSRRRRRQDGSADAQRRERNLWAFFQARTIRQTVLSAEADRAALDAAQLADPAARGAMEQQIGRWRATLSRWESEPETREGRRELAARAREAEEARDRAMKEDGRFDAAAALLQVGIVLASAGIITGTVSLAWVAGALGLAGAALSAATFAGLV
ncbi:DUF4337 family protein [Craurococcus roseus]|uniref:DUF4337 family protein n=1 Tax=Craurococcus roseus TaxID=77585 RepID=UPI0031D66254